MTSVINTTLKREIINSLYFDKKSTISRLSSTLNKSIPIVTKAISELIEKGVLVSADFAPSTGGRKAMQYAIRADNIYIVAVAMDRICTEISIFDVCCNDPAYSKKVTLDLSRDDLISVLADEVNEVIRNSDVPNSKFLGIGVGMPGFINRKTGSNQSRIFSDRQINIKEYLQYKLKLPVFIDNDSNLIALGESRFGIAKDKMDTMVINVGWGVGLGMIIKGKLFRGYIGYAGELSHIPIAENDILCECGKKGCLETEATLQVVARRAIEGINNAVFIGSQTTDSPVNDFVNFIIRSAKNGDQFCIELLSDMAYKIGKALAILIHIINPQQILISGEASVAGKLLVAPIQQALNKYCIPSLMEFVEVQISSLNNKAYSIGVAALVMENMPGNELV